MKRRRGSLTIEAVISMTIFISTMFLLLTMVKLVLFMIVFDNATTEAAKTLATAAYPLSYVNSVQDGLEQKVEYTKPGTVVDSLLDTGKNSILAQVMGGDGGKVASTGIGETISNVIQGVLVDNLKEEAYELKSWLVQQAGAQLVQKYITSTGTTIDASKLVLRHVKVPQTDLEYNTVYAGQIGRAEGGEGGGFVKEDAFTIQPAPTPTGTEGDFNAKDVVICLEYGYTLALPFLPSYEVTLRSIAVERAWLNGTATGPKRTEGINLSGVLFGGNQVVYIATGGHGTKYHKEDCNTLWTSQTPVTKEYAKEIGKTPCEVCKPG